MGGAVLVGAVGLLLGFRATLARPIPTAHEAPADTGLARVLNRKYYVDEIYDAVIVRPLVWLSRVVLWKGVDQGLVDGAAVNGTRQAVARPRLAGQPAADGAGGRVRGALPRRRALDPARRDPVTPR